MDRIYNGEQERIILVGSIHTKRFNACPVNDEKLVDALTEDILKNLVNRKLRSDIRKAVVKNITSYPETPISGCKLESVVIFDYRIDTIVGPDRDGMNRILSYSSEKDGFWAHDVYVEKARNELGRSIKELMEGNRKEY